LFSVSGDVRAPGVYELPLGTPLSTLLDMAGGPPDGDDWAAVLPGGYSMPPILPADFAVPLDPEALRALGSGLGASIIAVGRRRGLVSVLQDVLDFFARETCGKCPVCVKGSHVLAEEAGRLAEGRGGAGLEAAARKYRHKGICSFLDTAARFAESTIGQVG
jgi:NADH-quinone oxidoreductase subunit F